MNSPTGIFLVSFLSQKGDVPCGRSAIANKILAKRTLSQTVNKRNFIWIARFSSLSSVCCPHLIYPMVECVMQISVIEYLHAKHSEAKFIDEHISVRCSFDQFTYALTAYLVLYSANWTVTSLHFSSMIRIWMTCFHVTIHRCFRDGIELKIWHVSKIKHCVSPWNTNHHHVNLMVYAILILLAWNCYNSFVRHAIFLTPSMLFVTCAMEQKIAQSWSW